MIHIDLNTSENEYFASQSIENVYYNIISGLRQKLPDIEFILRCWQGWEGWLKWEIYLWFYIKYGLRPAFDFENDNVGEIGVECDTLLDLRRSEEERNKIDLWLSFDSELSHYIEIKAYFVTPYDNSLGSPKIYSINKKLEKIRKDVDALIALKKSGTKFAGRLSFTCFASWPRPSTFNLVKKLTSHIEEYFADYDNHTFLLDKVDEEGTICTLGVAI